MEPLSKQISPAVNSLEIPSVPNSTSFERHNRTLKMEYSKSNPNSAVVKELMKITFAMRRRDILSDGAGDIGKYPFLQTPEHVSVYM